MFIFARFKYAMCRPGIGRQGLIEAILEPILSNFFLYENFPFDFVDELLLLMKNTG